MDRPALLAAQDQRKCLVWVINSDARHIGRLEVKNDMIPATVSSFARRI